MKADEPGAYTGHLKYGLPVSEQGKIVERHFVVMLERKLLSDLHFADALRLGPGLRAGLDGIVKR